MREKNKEHSNLTKSVGITLGISLILSLATLLAGTWAVSSGSLSPDSMPVLSAVACGVGAFTSAMGGIAYVKKKTLLTGLTTGLSYFLLIYLVGAIVYFRAVPETSPVVLMLLASLVGGLIAGLLGRRKKRPTH